MADIRLAKPAAGASESVQCAPEARFVFDFPTTDATLARDGDNLNIRFEDGSNLQLEGFYQQYNEENLPSFNIDGTEVAAADFFAAMNEPDLMPAAGPGNSPNPTGARFHEWGDSALASGITHLNGLDWGFSRSFEWEDHPNAVGYNDDDWEGRSVSGTLVADSKVPGNGTPAGGLPVPEEPGAGDKEDHFARITVDTPIMVDDGTRPETPHGKLHGQEGSGQFLVDLHGDDGTITLSFGEGEDVQKVVLEVENGKGFVFADDANRMLAVQSVDITVTGASQGEDGKWAVQYDYCLKSAQHHDKTGTSDTSVEGTISIEVEGTTNQDSPVKGAIHVEVHDDIPLLEAGGWTISSEPSQYITNMTSTGLIDFKKKWGIENNEERIEDARDLGSYNPEGQSFAETWDESDEYNSSWTGIKIQGVEVQYRQVYENTVAVFSDTGQGSHAKEGYVYCPDATMIATEWSLNYTGANPGAIWYLADWTAGENREGVPPDAFWSFINDEKTQIVIVERIEGDILHWKVESVTNAKTLINSFREEYPYWSAPDKVSQYMTPDRVKFENLIREDLKDGEEPRTFQMIIKTDKADPGIPIHVNDHSELVFAQTKGTVDNPEDYRYFQTVWAHYSYSKDVSFGWGQGDVWDLENEAWQNKNGDFWSFINNNQSQIITITKGETQLYWEIKNVVGYKDGISSNKSFENLILADLKSGDELRRFTLIATDRPDPDPRNAIYYDTYIKVGSNAYDVSVEGYPEIAGATSYPLVWSDHSADAGGQYTANGINAVGSGLVCDAKTWIAKEAPTEIFCDPENIAKAYGVEITLPDGKLAYGLELELGGFFNTNRSNSSDILPEKVLCTFYDDSGVIFQKILTSDAETGDWSRLNLADAAPIIVQAGFNRVIISALDNGTWREDPSDFTLRAFSLITKPATTCLKLAGDVSHDSGADGYDTVPCFFDPLLNNSAPKSVSYKDSGEESYEWREDLVDGVKHLRLVNLVTEEPIVWATLETTPDGKSSHWQIEIYEKDLKIDGRDILELGFVTRDTDGDEAWDYVQIPLADDGILNVNADDHLISTAGSHKLIGNDEDNILIAGEGDDYLFGQNGNDLLIGDGGEVMADFVSAHNIIDLVKSGDGSEISALEENIKPESQGDDLLFGGHGDDVLLGMGGNDYLNGGAGQDIMFGGSGDDLIVYDKSDYLIDGGSGIDFLLARDADTSLGDLLTKGDGETLPIVKNVEVLIKGEGVASLTSLDQLAQEYGIGLNGDGKLTLGDGWQEQGAGDKFGDYTVHTWTNESAGLTLETTETAEIVRATTEMQSQS